MLNYAEGASETINHYLEFILEGQDLGTRSIGINVENKSKEDIQDLKSKLENIYRNVDYKNLPAEVVDRLNNSKVYSFDYINNILDEMYPSGKSETKILKLNKYGKFSGFKGRVVFEEIINNGYRNLQEFEDIMEERGQIFPKDVEENETFSLYNNNDKIIRNTLEILDKTAKQNREQIVKDDEAYLLVGTALIGIKNILSTNHIDKKDVIRYFENYGEVVEIDWETVKEMKIDVTDNNLLPATTLEVRTNFLKHVLPSNQIIEEFNLIFYCPEIADTLYNRGMLDKLSKEIKEIRNIAEYLNENSDFKVTFEGDSKNQLKAEVQQISHFKDL